MKFGDVVTIESYRVNSSSSLAFAVPAIGIYVRIVPYNHPKYSPSFPSCEILTPQGVRFVNVEDVRLT